MNVKSNNSLNLKLAILAAGLVFFLILTGCGKAKKGDEAPEIAGLSFEKKLDLSYAKTFKVYRYEGGFDLVHIDEVGDYLIVPEGKKAPSDLDNEIIVLNKPLRNIYLQATSAMALINDIGAMENLKFSGTNVEGWQIQPPIDALNRGDLIFAGKYSAPDYELLVDEKCNLAIESTMIYHTPEVKEKLEELGINVLVEKSSYEAHPLGRFEWIKLYGILFDKEEEAERSFEEQLEIVNKVKDNENTGKTVAYFYINSHGGVVTRKSNDYVSKMIKMAGGNYIFDDLSDDTKLSTINMTIEEFYASAKDVDILIYNSSIMEEVHSIDELINLSPVLADFKAVKNGNCWCTGKNLFQETNSIGGIIKDMHKIFNAGAGDATELDYFTKIK
ncbi:MAG: ABC transporter substrate-binding protein [Peptostreptococcaceae bacterium]|nr:ABC transporter substrate-binding protein [Peptostreptococcaceae bacterium]MDY5738824.1 ABC transporter substrate-binding protein [Anaerovoracaceae bacterium]